MAEPGTVVLAPGVHLPAWILNRLAERLGEAGFSVRRHVYGDFTRTLSANADRLFDALAPVAGPIHLVGHSLGGLLMLRLMELHPDPRFGRVVLMGTPYLGSHVARLLGRFGPTRYLLGESIRTGMLADRPRWNGQNPLGVVIGSRAIGGGVLAPGLPRPHDGMVAVSEAVVPDATDTIVLKVNHTEMLFSREAARQVIAFLREGRFDHGPAG
ncbi:MAG TPA: alpha/beta fold hydrolase [Pelomicrobium sp.]|nr:alpha/beta fold hydrolase [Pelomicrobium sp.]